MCFFTSGKIEDSTNKTTRTFAKVLWAGVARSYYDVSYDCCFWLLLLIACLWIGLLAVYFGTRGQVEDSTNKTTRTFAKVLWLEWRSSFTFFTKEYRKKVVFQWTLVGPFIRKYKSVSIASKRMGGHKKSIAKVCSGARKSSGGSIKCFKKEWFFHPFLFATTT